MSKKLTTEEFIQKARAVHGDTYGYGKVDYVNSQKKVVITCGIHGDFEQRPDIHLGDHGCPKCWGERNREKNREKNRERLEKARSEFIDKLRTRNPQLFNQPSILGVESIQYFGMHKPTKGLVCRKHGPLSPRANSLLRGRGACNKCANEVNVKTAQEARQISWDTQLTHLQTLHPNLDFSRITKENYRGVNAKHPVSCKLCGREWSPVTYSLLRGHGCGCNRSKYKLLPHVLYLLDFGITTKIGITHNIEQRMKKLTRAVPMDSQLSQPHLIHSFAFPDEPSAYKAEQALHQFYQDSHIDFSQEFPEGFDGSTEHFNLTLFQVNQATQLAEIMGGKLIK